MLKIPEIQYLLLWVFVFVIPSLVLLRIFRKFRIRPHFFYFAVSLVFLIATALRASGLYPGKYEPLWVDLSTAAISSLIAIFYIGVKTFINNLYLHLGLLFLIVIPHFIYVFTGENIGHPWIFEF